MVSTKDGRGYGTEVMTIMINRFCVCVKHISRGWLHCFMRCTRKKEEEEEEKKKGGVYKKGQ